MSRAEPSERDELVLSGSAAPIAWLPSPAGPYVAPEPRDELTWWSRSGAGEEVPAIPGQTYAVLGYRATAPGRFELVFSAFRLRIAAVAVQALDARGEIVTSHVSLSRTLPPELGSIPGPDEDALRFRIIAPPGIVTTSLQVRSRDARGQFLDAVPRLATDLSPCPPGVSGDLVCRESSALRAVGDALDVGQGGLRDRSLRVSVGGSVEFDLAGKKLLTLPVGGPRRTRLGPIERLRARLRVLVLRPRRGEAPAIGGSDALAREVMRREIAAASALWNQCGIELGPPGEPRVEIVDPPASQLVAVGCGGGQPASGGELRFKLGTRTVRLATRRGEAPVSVALRLQHALAQNARVRVFENPRASGEAMGTADLVIDGAAAIGFDGDALVSSDATLPLCVSGLDLNDGLHHFGDVDAFVGTVEERALLRGFDDGDARTIEVLVVPSFERSERIGESFIAAPGASLSSAVIIDRQAILAGARSFALAHELGHVLLAMPGHPDDFGVDQSWSLMDADVSDATIFGPRHLSVADCERALTQSGPDGLVPLLERVPLSQPLKAER